MDAGPSGVVILTEVRVPAYFGRTASETDHTKLTDSASDAVTLTL